MMRVIRIGAAVLLALGMLTTAASAKTYNAVKEFSTASNPHGAWSYLTSGRLDTTVETEACGTKDQGWSDGMGQPNYGGVIGNKAKSSEKCTSNGTVTIPAHTLNLDPEANANESVQWTAPKSGSYAVVGSFLGDDSSELSHSVAVEHNGTSIYSNEIDAFEQVDAFSLTVAVHAGDTIDFVVDTSAFHNLGTGLQVTIKKA